MEQEVHCEVKVAVLQQQVTDLKEIVLKLEEAIERINDVNLNVIKMLAVHEERINNNENNNQTVFNKVLELETKIATNKEEILKELNSNKTEAIKEINSLRNKIIAIVAASAVLVFIVSNSGFFGRLLHNTPDKKDSLTNLALYAKMI